MDESGSSRKAMAAASAPTKPARTPSPRKWRSNSRLMKRSVGADEMQHLDDLAVRRHGAPRRRDDDGDGGGDDERQHGQAAKRGRARQGLDLGLPAAVIVERDALEILRERVFDERDVGRIGAVDLDRDQARNGKRRERRVADRAKARAAWRESSAVSGFTSGDALLLGEEQRRPVSSSSRCRRC